MWDGVAVLDGDFGAIIAARAEQGADYAVLVFGAAERVVEDAEEGLWLDLDGDRGCAGKGGG